MNNSKTKQQRKNLIIKDYPSFADSISEINNAQVDNAKDIDLVMSMYNLIENRDYYSKLSRSLCQYYRNKPTLNANGAINDYAAANSNNNNNNHNENNNNRLFEMKTKVIGKTEKDGKQTVKIMIP